MKTQKPPSEGVTAQSLRAGLFEFLADLPEDHEFKKIIGKNIRLQQLKDYQLAA